MTKQVLISIRPEHAVNILNGKKTIELRKVVLKWVLEEVAKGNTVKFLMYCTKAEPLLQSFSDVLIELNPRTSKYILDKNWHGMTTIYNGKVVASFEVSKIEKYEFTTTDLIGYGGCGSIIHSVYPFPIKTCEDSCLTISEIEKYSDGKDIFALHISNLKVFDTPKELSDYYKETNDLNNIIGMTNDLISSYICGVKVTKAPQNMMTVWSEE